MCVPPSSPRNGYIYPYPNISSRVIIICTGSDMEELHISSFHPNGTWQPNPGSVCDTDEIIRGINFYTRSCISVNTPLFHMSDTKPTLSVSTTAIIISSFSSSFVLFIIGLYSADKSQDCFQRGINNHIPVKFYSHSMKLYHIILQTAKRSTRK